ncbi:negative cofactor 2 transcriptional co-repressor [Culex quinquefasciatus]|uniref:Negative cofactor 2 transcriptional co-repressor n=1 Tax=Culex quinquefasciatus TaxID=7176 RepID=B0WTF9_CULQU|nr:negative cofactor 2 transcriptional co-repressor [Culex quinquefasciatus]|eukprot:XP_001870879.1 negative cofactor 2 transcriptional co-repressor [Culex quinquefasciatus]
MKQCIISESRFDFLRDLVKNIPDIGVNEEQLSGSEGGYDPAATPSSSSTTSSNGGGGGGGDVTMPAATPGTSSSGLSLQRSESYTPVTINYAGTLPVKAQIQPPTQQPQPQGNSLKRTLNHVGFYKEISLEETGSGSSTSSSSTGSSREPPPKLTRLHSAPAATITTATKATSSIPFKIDILPTLPAALASSSQPRAVPATAPASSSNFKKLPLLNRRLFPTQITYKFEPLKDAPAPKATAQQPVFKLDYSNVKLPMTTPANPSPKPVAAPRHHPLQHQPTIKIDLSSITNYTTSNPSPLGSSSSSSSASSPSVVVKQQVPSATPPTMPLSAASTSSSSSNSGGSRNPYIFATGAASSSAPPAAALAPSYSSVSSSIPGMDEDYDDI